MKAELAPYADVTQRPPAVKDVHIFWITAGLGRDGDTVSITAGTLKPSTLNEYWRIRRRNLGDTKLKPHHAYHWGPGIWHFALEGTLGKRVSSPLENARAVDT